MPSLAPLVFFGTPDLAIPTLAALVAAGRAPALVVTQPPRPAGRGGQPLQPAVARWALEHGLPLAQPARVRAPEFLAELRPLRPAIAVVVAFGQIFPAELLALPAHGCINLHASMLPRFRGASPIQAALAAGAERTGVTIMRMDVGLDSGPILLQEEMPIAPRETAGELAVRLAALGARLMLTALDRLEHGGLPAVAQDAGQATHAARLTREAGRVDWTLTATELDNRRRAFTPWPGLTAELHGAPVKLLLSEPLPIAPTAPASPAASPPDSEPNSPPAAELISPPTPLEATNQVPNTAAAAPPAPPAPPVPAPGTFLGLRPAGIAVACGGGTVLAIAELQRPGRKPQRAADFVNGERLRGGERFA